MPEVGEVATMSDAVLALPEESEVGQATHLICVQIPAWARTIILLELMTNRPETTQRLLKQ